MLQYLSIRFPFRFAEVINDEAMTPILESEHQPWNDNYPLTQEDNGQRSSPSRNDLLQNEDGDDDDDSGNEEQDDNVNINRNRNNNKMIKSKALHHQSQAKEPERAEHVVQQNYQFDWKFLNERKRSSPPSHLFAASSFGVGGPPRRRLSLNEKQQQQSKYNNNNNNNNNNNKQLNQYAHIADSRKMIAGGGGGGGVAAAAPTALLSEDTMDSSMEVEPSVLPLLGFHSAAVQYNYNRPNDAIIKKILRQAGNNFESRFFKLKKKSLIFIL